jgi:peptidyl-tRNA hydrolase, PTH1 family
MKMVVGLGNPGPEYARNRHNIGFQIVEVFAQRHGLRLDKAQKRARLAIGDVALQGGTKARVMIAKPLAYMNASGEPVAGLAAFYRVLPADILVVSDDLDLPAGRLRLRAGGGAGGQKGIASIIQHLHTDAFPRLRAGIGRPPGRMDPADYVLQNFSPAEESEMVFVRIKAADAIEVWLAQGIEAAMNQFNAPNDLKAPSVPNKTDGAAAAGNADETERIT